MITMICKKKKRKKGSPFHQPRQKCVHEVMNFDGSFMNVHDQFMPCSSNISYIELFIKALHDLFMNT